MKISYWSLVAGCLLVISNFANAADILYFTSSPTSWVGKGQTKMFTAPESAFTADIHYNAVRLFYDTAENWYNLAVIGPNQSLPAVGFYANATRYPFNGSGPGLDFSGNGAGNNTLTGYFNVLQADYDLSGNVVSFAVDFMQYDSGVTTRWVQGSFRYNSDIPVPEPGTIGMMGIGAMLIRRRKSSKF